MSRFLLFLSVLLSAAGSVTLCCGDIVISEFMAENDSAFLDGDGNPSDWIEIYNTSSSEVDLTGWYLTDDANDLQRWPFPSMSIRGGDFLIVFASGQEVDDYVDSLGYLHTNFKLSKNDAEQHESVLLVMPDGETVAHGYPDYPEQSEDVSYGLAQEMEFTTLVREGADAVALVPEGPVENWTAIDFDDAAWPLTGSTGVGYERDTGYESLIGLDVISMWGVNTSVYVRIEFEVAAPSVFDLLTLRMKYDDGFIAYLNRDFVAAANDPESPSWNSSSDGGHEASATQYEDFDITDWVGSLVSGRNVLAIHGLNISPTSSDMLVLPEMIAVDLSDVVPDTPMFLTAPTPGWQNMPGVLGYVSDVRFSVDHGFFTEPFDVVIATATEGTEVYYTLNGSKPTPETGIPYGNPITVSGTTVLRAAAFKPGCQPSKTGTQTYLFLNDAIRQDYQATLDAGLPSSWGGTSPDYGLDPDVIGTFDQNGNPTGNDKFGGIYAAKIRDALKAIPTLSLAMNVDDMFGPNGIYTNSTQEGVAWERETSAELIYPDGDEGFQVNCGIRIQGGWFRSHSATKKHSFRLLFKSEYGATKLTFPLFGDGAVDRFDTITLRAGANDGYTWDAAYLTEQYTRDEFGRSLQRGTGQAGAHGMFVHLYINGIYWGLYNPAERPDHSFSASYYGGDKDDWDAIHDGSPTNGDTAAWNQMISKCRSGLSTNEAYQEVQGNNPDGAPNPNYPALLDATNYIDYLIVNLWGGNWDWPWKNWWACRDRSAESTGFKFYCWDYENTMGNNRGRSPLDKNALNNDFSSAGEPHQYLKQNAEYRLLFGDRVHRLFLNGGILTPESLVPPYAELAAEIESPIIAESARWGDQHYSTPLTQQEWYNERDWILKTYLPRRPAIVLQQFKDAGLYPSVPAPTFAPHGGSFTEGSQLWIKSANTIYYTLDGTDPREFGAGRPLGTLYEGALTLETTTLVKARAMSGAGEWSALNEALFVLDTPSPLRITEIMYHSRAPSEAEANGTYTADDFDFIELRNTASKPIGLAGITFTDGVLFDFTKSGIHTFLPGEYVVVVKDLAAFKERYADWATMNVAGEFLYPADVLANGGEGVALKDGLGRTILSFAYDDEWYVNTDGLGHSLVVLNESASTDAWTKKTGWRPSTNIDGSPGQDDPAPPNIPAVVINEALTRTVLPVKDAIELYNPTGVPADIGGWFLTDDRTNPRKFCIPEGTEIPVGGYWVFDEDDFNADPDSTGSFLLSSLGEDVYLFSADAEGNLTGYAHGFRFGAAESGVSFGRYITSTADEHFVAQLAGTLNDANAGPKVGPVVINEIMFDPFPSQTTNTADLEYLELRNISSEDVPLFDPDIPENTWHIGGGVDYSFPADITLPPGGYALIVRFDPRSDVMKLNAFRFRYSLDESVRMFGPYTGHLENLGERVTLSKPGEPKLPPDPDAGTVPYIVVDQVDYSDSAPWPTGANGTGESLQRLASGRYGNDPINWEVAPPTPGRDNPGASTEDADEDEMPDAWETEHFGGTNVPGGGAAEDWDKDGSCNLDEYLAGTNPTDPSSVLAISTIVNGSDSRIIIRWRSVSGKSYSILKATDLAAGFDQVEAAHIPATPPENSYMIPINDLPKSAFYRVVADP
ncbi:MAG: lamin tail domain-containing protein [bacterium]|nr:lamin tail domain-containing protein [bacterium]